MKTKALSLMFAAMLAVAMFTGGAQAAIGALTPDAHDGAGVSKVLSSSSGSDATDEAVVEYSTSGEACPLGGHP